MQRSVHPLPHHQFSPVGYDAAWRRGRRWLRRRQAQRRRPASSQRQRGRRRSQRGQGQEGRNARPEQGSVPQAAPASHGARPAAAEARVEHRALGPLVRDHRLALVGRPSLPLPVDEAQAEAGRMHRRHLGSASQFGGVRLDEGRPARRAVGVTARDVCLFEGKRAPLADLVLAKILEIYPDEKRGYEESVDETWPKLPEITTIAGLSEVSGGVHPEVKGTGRPGMNWRSHEQTQAFPPGGAKDSSREDRSAHRPCPAVRAGRRGQGRGRGSRDRGASTDRLPLAHRRRGPRRPRLLRRLLASRHACACSAENPHGDHAAAAVRCRHGGGRLALSAGGARRASPRSR